jgi:hypothetical protein
MGSSAGPACVRDQKTSGSCWVCSPVVVTDRGGAPGRRVVLPGPVLVTDYGFAGLRTPRHESRIERESCSSRPGARLFPGESVPFVSPNRVVVRHEAPEKWLQRQADGVGTPSENRLGSLPVFVADRRATVPWC